MAGYTKILEIELEYLQLTLNNVDINVETEYWIVALLSCWLFVVPQCSIFNQSFNGCTLRYWAFTDVLKWRELKTCSFLPYVRRIRIDGEGEHSVSMILSDLLESTLNIEQIDFIQCHYEVEQTHLQYIIPPTLKRLKFENYSLLPLESFPENLQDLDINNCHVESLHLLLFPPKLKRLRLIHCGITTLPHLPEYLHYLEISQENLTTLPELPPLLHTLICDAAKLSRLPPLPQTLRVLEVSNIYNTLIGSLPSSLEKLSLTHSSQFVQNFPQLSRNLVSLRLNYCDIVSIPPNYLPKTLRSLDLSKNRISTLAELTPKLEVLELTHNKLKKLPVIPPTLVSLHLSHNDLTELPQLPPRLKSLRCKHNQISEWPFFPETLISVRISCNVSPSLLEEAINFASKMFDSSDDLDPT
ncbi:hypothetical protein BKA69DRAFT_1143601 [Paraphysoderma sedebokerense]|nr:hypothetical protein BKA69DRAFT_1143601 [Paraphysoderma sedebokerense]